MKKFIRKQVRPLCGLFKAEVGRSVLEDIAFLSFTGS